MKLEEVLILVESSQEGIIQQSTYYRRGHLSPESKRCTSITDTPHFRCRRSSIWRWDTTVGTCFGILATRNRECHRYGEVTGLPALSILGSIWQLLDPIEQYSRRVCVAKIPSSMFFQLHPWTGVMVVFKSKQPDIRCRSEYIWKADCAINW